MDKRKRSEASDEAPPRPRRRRRTSTAVNDQPAVMADPEAVPAPPESDRSDSQPADDPFRSASELRGEAPTLPPVPDLRRGFESVVRKIFSDGMDVEATFDEVEASLSVRGALTPGALSKAANSAEDMANKAFRLFVVAKFETDAYMRETEAVVGAMREAATKVLQTEKSQGLRSKQITDADVLGKVATLYPDEWAAVCERRDKARGMLAQIENLAGLARSRSYTASNLLGASNKPKV